MVAYTINEISFGLIVPHDDFYPRNSWRLNSRKNVTAGERARLVGQSVYKTIVSGY